MDAGVCGKSPGLVGQMRDWILTQRLWTLRQCRSGRHSASAGAWRFSALMFLAVALWNGFPADFLRHRRLSGWRGWGASFWWNALRSIPCFCCSLAGGVQPLAGGDPAGAMTAYLIALTARTEVDRLSLGRLIMIGRGPDAGDRHRLVCGPGRARLHDRAGDPGRLSAAVSQPVSGPRAKRAGRGDHRSGGGLPSLASGLDGGIS